MLNLIVLRLIHYVLALGAFFKQWIFRIPALSYKKTDSLTIQADARQLQKLPLHLGMLFLEEDLSYTDIANAVLWSVAMGISYISIYDTYGTLKRNIQPLNEAIEKGRSYQLDSEHSKTEIVLHSSKDDTGTCKSPSCIYVYLISLEDGRESIVSTARTICRRVVEKDMSATDITPQTVDKLLQEKTGYPDPDLILRFGTVDSLMGFLPWQIRLSEIISLPTHHSLSYKTFNNALRAYGDTEQRFGK